MCRALAALVIGLLASVPLIATAADASGRQGVYLAPGWGDLSFEAPPPGTYNLPPMQDAAGGTLLGTDGQLVELADLLRGKITLLGFIYRTCHDVNGCPLSTMVLRTVAKRLKEDPEVSHALRLVTISFDPENDTPEAMAAYSKTIRGETELDWHFLTSESDAQIRPLLDAYQQSVVEDATGTGEGKFSHILRVYLIDDRATIRNIYSLSFLHPDILINDVKTLVMERSTPSVATSP